MGMTTSTGAKEPAAASSPLPIPPSSSPLASAAVQPLHLIVIGGGLSGLAAAITLAQQQQPRQQQWRVTVLERAAGFDPDLGNGLQLTPNATRLLGHWGIADAIAAVAAAPSSLMVRRFDGSRVLRAEEDWQARMAERYDGSPFWDVHRADLLGAMVARAVALGVDLRWGAEVVGVDFDRAEVSVRRGDGGCSEAGLEHIRGDVVLAADGIWSAARGLLLRRREEAATKPSNDKNGSSNHNSSNNNHNDGGGGALLATPRPTGDLAYRIVLALDEVARFPELAAWVANPTVNFWIGPQAHVVAYSLRGGREFNLVLLCPDDLPEGLSRENADLDEMTRRFEGWDPVLLKFLSCVKIVDKWKLMHFPAMDDWTDRSGRFTMAGDACHPMLPYLAQGANSSMEDGAALGLLLAKVASADGISHALQTYHELRKGRVEAIQAQAFRQRYHFHMPDGPAQEERDRILADAAPPPSVEFPSCWSCPKVQPWLYGYDVLREVGLGAEEHRGSSKMQACHG